MYYIFGDGDFCYFYCMSQVIFVVSVILDE